MILCSLCNARNHHLAVVCASCGSFLQARAENLDLFASAWSVLEKPRKAFRTIALSHHKNYVILLSAVAGIAFVFSFFWGMKVGEYSESLFNLLSAGLATGPPTGIVIVLLFSLIVTLIARMMRVRVAFRNVVAVHAYALVPVILSIVLILPIEILTFGQFFFTRSPSPYALRPLSYIVLLGLDGGFTLWSAILVLVGMHVIFDVGWIKSLTIMLVSILLCSGAVAGAAHLFLPKFCSGPGAI